MSESNRKSRSYPAYQTQSKTSSMSSDEDDLQLDGDLESFLDDPDEGDLDFDKVHPREYEPELEDVLGEFLENTRYDVEDEDE